MIRRTTTLFALALALAPASALAQQAPKEPPAAIKTMLGRMAGTWTAKDVAVTVGGKASRVQSKATCAKIPGGGLQCHVRVSEGGSMRDEETSLLGWDPETGKVHLFSVNQKYTHDHVGTLEGDVLSLAYSGTRDGKPWEESLTFTFKGDKELVWKDTCTSAGQVVFSGEGTYHK